LARLARLIILAALVKGLVVLFLIPPFQTPDEYAHYDYVVYLARVDPIDFLLGRVKPPVRINAIVTRELYCLADVTGTRAHLESGQPVTVNDGPVGWIAKASRPAVTDTAGELAGKDAVGPAFMYPPLYYACQAALYRVGAWLGLNTVARYYGARMFSLLLFVASLALAARLLWALRLPAAAFAAVLFFAAFQPELSMLSVSVQPDNMTLFLLNAGLLLLAGEMASPTRWGYLAFCVLAGLLLLTKLHFFVALFVPALAAFVVQRARGDRARREVVWLAAGVLVTAVVGGWWYLRSYLLYGHLLGLGYLYHPPGVGSVADNLLRWVRSSLPLVFQSYWGKWGWLDYGFSRLVFRLLRVVSVAPLAVYLLVFLAWRPTLRRSSLEQWRRDWRVRYVVLLGCSFALFSLEMVYIAATMGPWVNNQGRNWLPFVLVQAVYFCGPILLVSDRLPEAFRRWHPARPALRAVAGMTSLAAACVLVVIAVRVPVDGYVVIRMRPLNANTVTVAYDAGAAAPSAGLEGAEVRLDARPRTYRFPVRGREVSALRLDPGLGQSGCLLYSVAIEDRNGRVLAAVPLDRLRPTADMRLASEGAVVRVESSGSAPRRWLELPLDRAVGFPSGRARRAVNWLRTRLDALWPDKLRAVSLESLLFLLLLCSGLAAATAALARSPARPARSMRFARLSIAWGWAVLLVALNLDFLWLTWHQYWRG
jgi:hypothetical protein